MFLLILEASLVGPFPLAKSVARIEWNVPPLYLPHCSVQSEGRSMENSATCPTLVAADAGCAPSSPHLNVLPSSQTKWIFEPAGGGIERYYIRLQVSLKPRCLHFEPEYNPDRCCLPLVYSVLPADPNSIKLQPQLSGHRNRLQRNPDATGHEE